MSTNPDTQKQLEEIFGADALQLIKFIQSVATLTESSGLVIEKNLLVATPNRCSTFPHLLDVAGFFTTGSDGKSFFRLTDFFCPTGKETFVQPVNFVATPFSSRPCYLTVVHSLVNEGANVEFNVSSWDASGAPAPNVSFNWRCRVPLQQEIIL